MSSSINSSTVIVLSSEDEDLNEDEQSNIDTEQSSVKLGASKINSRSLNDAMDMVRDKAIHKTVYLM